MFNVQNDEWKGESKNSLFLGQPLALHDTIHVSNPKIRDIALRQVSQRWVFDEFNHSQSRIDMLTCPKNVYDVMLMNLAYQWEADSVASRAVAPLFAPFVTNSELWEALLENCNMEITHSKSYSEVVRQCVADPNEVFKLVMENENVLKRADYVNQVFRELQVVGAKQMLGMNVTDAYGSVMMGIIALWCLERVQFMASFAATFALVEQGYFQSIGTMVQKIMIDELLCHAALDEEVINVEKRQPRFNAFISAYRPAIKNLVDCVVEREIQWAQYLFSQGRNIVGLNAQLLSEWVMWNAKGIYEAFSISPEHSVPTSNPLPWMDTWIDIDKRQNANQETRNGNYALNSVKNDIGDDVLQF